MKGCVDDCHVERLEQERIQRERDAVIIQVSTTLHPPPLRLTKPQGLEELHFIMIESEAKKKQMESTLQLLQSLVEEQEGQEARKQDLLVRFTHLFQDVDLQKNEIDKAFFDTVDWNEGDSLEALFKLVVDQSKHRGFYDAVKSCLALEPGAVNGLFSELDDLHRALASTNNSPLEEKKRDIARLQEELKLDFGPNNTLVSLLGQEFSMTSGEHEFRFKPFDTCTQGPSHTSLGRFHTWIPLVDGVDVIPQELNEGTGIPKPTIMMDFTQGQACYQGTIRSTKVYLRCGGGGTEFLKVFEPEMCRYVFLFKSPLACFESEALLLSRNQGGVFRTWWNRAKSWFGVKN
jgi:hypothetical protein